MKVEILRSKNMDKTLLFFDEQEENVLHWPLNDYLPLSSCTSTVKPEITTAFE